MSARPWASNAFSQGIGVDVLGRKFFFHSGLRPGSVAIGCYTGYLMFVRYLRELQRQEHGPGFPELPGKTPRLLR